LLTQSGCAQAAPSTFGAVTLVELTETEDGSPTVLDFDRSDIDLPRRVLVPQSLLRDLFQRGNAVMVVTKLEPERLPELAARDAAGEKVVLQAPAIELSFMNENDGVLTLANISGSEGIIFTLDTRLPFGDERCGFYDVDLNAWSEVGTQLLSGVEVNGETVNASWCHTTHTSLFGLFRTLPLDDSIEVQFDHGPNADVAVALAACAMSMTLCGFLVFLVMRWRAPSSGHLRLVTRQGQTRRLSFECAQVTVVAEGENGHGRNADEKERGLAAVTHKVHVTWEEDRSILQDLHNLRQGSRRVVLQRDFAPAPRKVTKVDSANSSFASRPCQEEGQLIGSDLNGAEEASNRNELVDAGPDDLFTSHTEDVVSAGVDDFYFLETESIVSAGMDVFMPTTVFEAYQEGEWVFYFSSTLACLVPARVAGPGAFQSDGASEMPCYSCRVGARGQLREGVPLSALRPLLEPGDAVDTFSSRHNAWIPALVLKAAPLLASSHRATFQVKLVGVDGEDGCVEVPLRRLRRRFEVGDQVEAYLGRGAGWVQGTVSATRVEIPLSMTLSQKSEESMAPVQSLLDMDQERLSELDTVVPICLAAIEQEVEVPTSQLRSCRQSKL